MGVFPLKIPIEGIPIF